MPDQGARGAIRTRRQPPPFRTASVAEVEELGPRMLRVVAGGSELCDFATPEPAASIRVLVPAPGDRLVLPQWNGNEFLMPDGERPLLRTFTPVVVDADSGLIEFWVVRHPGGAVSGWAETAKPGDPLAISGPGSGYELPDAASSLLVLGDETAIPAVRQLAGVAAQAGLSVEAHVEVIDPGAVLDLGFDVRWHVTQPGAVAGRRLVEVVDAVAHLDEGVHVWAAGEASAMQAIRKRLFDALGVERTRTSVRGYWKPQRG